MRTIVYKGENVEVWFFDAVSRGVRGYYLVQNKSTKKVHKCDGETGHMDAMRHADDAQFGTGYMVYEFENNR